MKYQLIPILNLKLDSATCSMLILDQQFHILLDCGLNQRLDFSPYKANQALIEQTDVILLTHSSLEYTGALPFILEHMKISPQIFSTTPIQKFGYLNLYDAFLNILLLDNTKQYDSRQAIQLFYTSFEKCQTIQFQQRKFIKKHSIDICVSPHCIGNTLGACAWKIEQNLVNILYLSTYNHQKELHLEGMNLDILKKNRIDILITDAFHNEKISPRLISNSANSQNLRSELKQHLNNVIEKTGNVVISCYPNERIIELLLILHKIWKEPDNLFVKNDIRIEFFRNNKEYLNIVKSNLDFMSKDVANKLHINDNINEQNNEQNKNSPFAFDDDKFIQLIDKLPDIHIEKKRVILTTYNSLLVGPLYSYLIKLVGDNSNSLIIIGRPEKDLLDATQKIKENFKSELNIFKQKQDVYDQSILEKLVIDQQQQIKPQDTTTATTDYQTALTTTQFTNIQPPQKQQKNNMYKDLIIEQPGLPVKYLADTRVKMPQPLNQNIIASQQRYQSQLFDQEEQKIEDEKIDVEDDFENMNQTMKNREREVLFEIRDFPRFKYHEPVHKQNIYGEILEDYLINPNKINTSLLAQNVIQIVDKTENLKKTIDREFSNFVDIKLFNTQFPRNLSLDFKMKVKEIPYIGQCDNQSSLNIITLLNPNHTFLINGKKEEHEYTEKLINQKKLKNIFYQAAETITLDNSCQEIVNFKQSLEIQRKIQEVRANLKMIYDYQTDLSEVSLSISLGQNTGEQKFFGHKSIADLIQFFNQKQTDLQCQLSAGKIFIGTNSQYVIISKQNDQFLLSGNYSQLYQNVRQLLYQFFKM